LSPEDPPMNTPLPDPIAPPPFRIRRAQLSMAAGLAALLVVAAAILGFRTISGGWPWSPPGAGQPAFGGPFQLVDASGRPISDETFHGKWLVLFFGYTHCPDVCPTTLADVAQALDRLGPGADQIQPLFVTVDPERDDPAVLRDYTASFGNRILGATGSAQQIAAIAKAFHVYYAKHPEGAGYSMDHSSILYVMRPDGSPAGFLTPDIGAVAIADKLKGFMTGG
jgi:protein SCO1